MSTLQSDSRCRCDRKKGSRTRRWKLSDWPSVPSNLLIRTSSLATSDRLALCNSWGQLNQPVRNPRLQLYFSFNSTALLQSSHLPVYPIMAGGKAKYRHLGRKSSHRQALLRNLVTSLFENESITTTWAKAKEAQRLADKLITLGKKNSEASRRRALEIFYVCDYISGSSIFSACRP